MNRLQQSSGRGTPRRDRRGYIMMVVVITMAVIILTLIAMVRQVSIVANAVRSHKERSQVVCLLESGIERAKAKRKVDSEFSGETWSVFVSSNQNQPAAVVEIRIHDDSTFGTAVSIEVTVPKKSRPNLTARRTVPLSLPTTADK